MNQVAITQGLLEKYVKNGNLNLDDLSVLFNSIEYSAEGHLNNFAVSAITGKLLLFNLDLVTEVSDKIKYAHLTLLFIQNAIDKIEDKNNIFSMVEFAFNRMENAMELAEMFYLKMSLINNYQKYFINTIKFLIENDVIYKYDSESKSTEVSRIISAMVHSYTTSYLRLIDDLIIQNREIPAPTKIVTQIVKIIDSQNLTSKECEIGEQVDLVLYKTISKMTQKGLFNFMDPIEIKL